MPTHLNHPTSAESTAAREASTVLGPLARSKKAVTLRILNKQRNRNVTLPGKALVHLQTILTQMAQGHAVSVIPDQSELTTVQAADILNVSRPFVIKLLDEGKIASRKVGSHRRVLLKDLLVYKKQMHRLQKNALDELAAEAQKLDLGY